MVTECSSFDLVSYCRRKIRLVRQQQQEDAALADAINNLRAIAASGGDVSRGDPARYALFLKDDANFICQLEVLAGVADEDGAF